MVIKHPEPGPFAAVEIDYGPLAPGLASATGADTDIAVRLTLAEEPQLAAVVTCEREKQEYCYSEMTGDDPSGWVLTEDAAAAKKVAELATIHDQRIVRTAHQRAKEYRAPAAASPPPEPKVVVDASRCKSAPDRCGQLSYLGGRFWSVITDNEAGENPSEDRQLFDAKSLEFINPDGWLRSRRPHADLADLRSRVAPGGRYGFIDGSMIDLGSGKYLWGRGDTLECGWLGPRAKSPQ